MRVLAAGLRGALVEAGPSEPAAVAAAVRQLADRLGVPLAEVVPGARTVLVLAVDRAGLARLLPALPGLASLAQPDLAQLPPVTLEVTYDGPDLGAVADATGRSAEEVVRRHSGVTYRAAFTGFAPGFAYLTGLDVSLQLPRRDTPRAAVPAGSVAIADTYTAVYPRSSPGGWHLLGTVAVPLFDLRRRPVALISPGQAVRFVPVQG